MTDTRNTPNRIPAISVVAMTFAGGIARSSTLLSQIIVGNFLTGSEIGTYAVAVGITGFTCMLRGGGASHYLPTIGREEYDASSGRIFWWGFWFRIFAALATAATAFSLPFMELKEEAPQLTETLLVFSLSQALLAFTVVGRIRMAVNDRFPTLAKLDVGTAIFRVVATAVLAWAGAGPLALVIPIAMAPAVELAFYALNGTMSSIKYRWSGGTVKATAALMLWPAIVSILLSLNSQSNFLIVKPMLALAGMGVYYFAYQLASQPMMMLATPLTSVLATHFARERGDPAREAAAVIQTAGGAVLFSSLACCGLIAVFPATERLLWAGKWADANLAVAALATAGCWATAVTMLSAALAGLRRFKAMAAFEAVKGFGIFAGAALGALLIGLAEQGAFAMPAWIDSNSTLVSVATGTTIALTSIVQLVWILRVHRSGLRAKIRIVLQGPTLGGLAAVGSMLGGSYAATLIEAPTRMLALFQFGCTGAMYVVLALIVVRLTASGAMRDAIELLPTRVRPALERLLAL